MKFRVEHSTLWDPPVVVAADLSLEDAAAIVSALMARTDDDAVWTIVPDLPGEVAATVAA